MQKIVYIALLIINLNLVALRAQAQFRKSTQPISWELMESDHFNLFYEAGGDQLAKSILPYCVSKLEQIEEKIGYRQSGKLDIYLYPTPTALNAGYAQQNFDANQSLGGITLVQNSHIHVAYQGSQTILLSEISDAIAENLITEMLFGGTIQERIKYATMLHLPTWFAKGLAQYLARGWDDQADNQLRDGFNNAQFASFNKLSEENQILTGRSMWQYLEEMEGPVTIQRVLYLVRLTRKVESALHFVIQMDSKDLYEHWYDSKSGIYATELKRRMPAQAERINFPVATSTLLSLDLSPDAGNLAAAVYEGGMLKVNIYDRSNQSQTTIFSQLQAFPGFKPVSSMLVVKWINERELFLIQNGPKPRLMTMNLSGQVLNSQILELDYVHWIDFNPQSEEMVLSATKQGVANLFLYDVGTNKITQITNDLADNLYPTFDFNGNIYFSKLVKSEKKESTEQQQYDLFLMERTDTLAWTAKNISNTPEFNEFYPLQLHSNFVSFISNRNGVRNAYAYTKGDIFALTDYQSNIKLQIANQTRSKIAEVVLKGAVWQVYISDTEVPSNLGSVLHPINTRTKDKIKTIWTIQSKDGGDTSSETAKTTASNLFFQSEFPVPENVDSLEKIREELFSQNVYESVTVGTRQFKLLPTAIYSSLDNSNLLTSTFPSFSPPSTTVLNRFGILLGLRLEDQFKFHTFSMKLKTSTSLNKFQFNLNYQNRKGLGVKDLTMATENITSQIDGIFKNQELRFFDGYWWIPQPNKFTFGFHHSTRFDGLTTLGSERELFESRPVKQLNTINGFVLKYGSPLAISKWATIGWNISFSTDWVTGLSNAGNSMNNGLKLTYGKEVKHKIVWFSRLNAGTSRGKLRTVYFLGGSNNQISPNFLPNEVLSEGNAYFQPVYGVRNFDINVRNGTSYFFANTELQIPAYQWLSRKPLHNPSLQNLWLVMFADAGTSWYGKSPYDRLNPANRTNLSYGALDIVVYNTKNPLVYSFGSGIRTQISGYDLRYDMAYTFDNNVWRPHIHRFSIGLPF